jgi:WD40 repeat protein
VQTGEALQLLEGHSDRILSVEFNPDGHFAISADNARTIRLWNLDTSFTAYTYQGHTNRVTAAHFSPDGRRILTASHDSTVIIWKFPQPIDELANWARTHRYQRELTCSEYILYVDSNYACPESTEIPEATDIP